MNTDEHGYSRMAFPKDAYTDDADEHGYSRMAFMDLYPMNIRAVPPNIHPRISVSIRANPRTNSAHEFRAWMRTRMTRIFAEGFHGSRTDEHPSCAPNVHPRISVSIRANPRTNSAHEFRAPI
jgi:hypothetical protein